MLAKQEILFPPDGKMNFDVDQRAMPPGDVREVINCRWGRNKGESIGAVENLAGNVQVSFGSPSGNNYVIGACEDRVRDALIFFMYNDENNHSIFRYNRKSNDVDAILWSQSVLAFNYNKKIINPIVVDNGDDAEGLLYWVDGYNPPRKLNIERARKWSAENYNEGIGYWIIESDFIVS